MLASAGAGAFVFYRLLLCRRAVSASQIGTSVLRVLPLSLSLSLALRVVLSSGWAGTVWGEIPGYPLLGCLGVGFLLTAHGL